MTNNKQTFEIISYDVWGNERDGYEINDKHNTGLTVSLPEHATDKQIIDALKKEYLCSGLHTKTFSIDGDPDYSLYIERTINGKQTGYPVCELRRS